MNAKEFNEKYKDFLMKGHYGLDINNSEIVNYLDGEFKNLIKIPGFHYTQIKLKFGMARVYLHPNSIDTSAIEGKINEIVKSW